MRRPGVRAFALGIALALAAGRAGANAATLAQLTLPTAPTGPAPGVVRDGAYLVAPVMLDGRVLFRIAAPASGPAGGLPLDQRAADVETDLDQLVAVAGEQRTAYDPRSLRVRVTRHGEVDALDVVDATHPEPLAVVTVTSADAKYGQTDPDALASEWRGVLQSALVRALVLRQPATQRRSMRAVELVGGLLLSVTLVLSFALVALRRRVRESKDAVAGGRPTATATATATEVPRRFLAARLRLQEPERRRRLYRASYESLCLLLALAWFVAIAWAGTLFPQTTPIAHVALRGAFAVATTLLIAGLLNRGLDVAIERVAGVFGLRSYGAAEDRARAALRVPTISRALSGFKTFAIVFVTVLAVLGEVGVPIGSVVTIGGLAAIALSLAAQNFVRDFVNGALVLFEDHYVVGDFIAINAYAGIVETLSLRMVQLRDASGDLITIPHSSVAGVVNQSRNWSRVDFRVPVDPTADVATAIRLVREAIETLAGEDAWRGAIVEPVEWIGLDALSRDWAIVRASVRTAPLRQFALKREITLRVHAAFAAGGVALGAPIPGVPSPT